MLRVVDEHGITVKSIAFNGLGEIEKLVELGKIKGKGIIIIYAEQIAKEKAIGANL